jgi:hypothetical protein
VKIRSELMALVFAAIALPYAGFASADSPGTTCYWDGSPPFCVGRCMDGFVVTERKACVTGHKVKCCELSHFISQGQGTPECTPARYGQPGCPYPGFGTTSLPPRCPTGEIGRPPHCRLVAGAKCGTGLIGTPPNCYPNVR